MRIKFTRDHDEVEPTRTVSYREGDEATVSKDRAEILIPAGIAEAAPEKVEKPEKGEPKKGSEGGR